MFYKSIIIRFETKCSLTKYIREVFFNTKFTDVLFEQTHLKTQETNEFKLAKSIESFSFHMFSK